MPTMARRNPIPGGLFAVFRHELRASMYAPLTYVFLSGFLLALSVSVFLIGDFYATDEASIHLLVVFLPWVALVFVPALAMRAWVEAAGDQSLELIRSLPLSPTAVVGGKFLAGYAVLLIGLVLTWPLVATVFYLGSPDGGVIASAYLGSALLVACCYAIALYAASFAREPVGGFVGGCAALFILLAVGWDSTARLIGGHLPPGVLAELAVYSPKAWLDAMGEGFVELSGLAYLTLVALFALAGTGINIARRRRGGGFGWAVACGVFVMAGIAIAMPLASQLDLFLDLTAEREFTLSRGSVDVLDSVPAGAELTLYWSASEPSVPAGIKSHARRATRFLERLVQRSNDRVSLRTLDPEPDTDAELEALSSGLRRIQMTSGDHFYLGATFQQGDRVTSIPYFDLSRDRFLEYDIAVALNGLSTGRVPKVAILSPLLPASVAANGREGFSFLEELKRAYDVAVIPFFDDSLPDGLDVLLVLDASVVKKRMLYAIDQYLVRGGSVIVMLDPFVRFNPPSNQVRPQPSQEIDDVSDLLLAYGIRFVGDSVVGDADLASPVSDQDRGAMSFPFWLRVASGNFSDSHPVTATLNEGLFVEAGALEWENLDRAQVLVRTTANSGTRERIEFTHSTPRELATGFLPDGRSRAIAAVLPGPFESAHPAPLESAGASDHVMRGTDAGLLFVVADVDWLFDPFALQTVDLGGQIVTRPLNDNLTFLLNMVEYASGKHSLIEIRSRGRLQRPFSRVAALFQAAEQAYRQEEQEITERLSKAEALLAAVAEEAGVTDVDDLPAEFQDQVQTINAALLPMRKQLRDIRRRIREDVEDLGRRLTLINIGVGPMMVLFLAGIVFAVRGYRHRAGAL